ncbi:helical backbone metal receptor [Chitinophagales bacterium]|nr:helical backbone metal receptor [Chitinophagales bacterium]
MSEAIRLQDQLGRTTRLDRPAVRIVSLVPSITEYLFYLGLTDEVVGITKFCERPNWAFRTKPLIGGTKTPKIDAIAQLKPDLVIANKEENRKEDIEAISEFAPVYTSQISNRAEALEMMQSLALCVGKETGYLALEREIAKDATHLPKYEAARGLYLIWRKPWMAAGSDTYIHAMMGEMGIRNVLAEKRYPSLTEQEILDLNPNLVLLSSEPFPFKAKHIAELKELLPNAEIALVDGQVFSWYGNRVKYVGRYCSALFNRHPL